MLKICTGFCVFLTAVLFTAIATSAPAPNSLDQSLAGLNYQNGVEVDSIQEFQLEGRKMVGARHLIILMLRHALTWFRSQQRVMD